MSMRGILKSWEFWLACFAFALAFVAIWQIYISTHFVTVNIHNTIQKPVAIRLEHEDGVITRTLNPNQKVTIRFVPNGETSYNLIASVGDQTYTSENGYVEASYRINETISEKGIKTVSEFP